MPLPSLHSMRGVVDIFIRKIASMEVLSKEAPSAVGEETEDKAYQGAIRQLDDLGVNYQRDMLRVLGDILQEAIPISDDPAESSFWGDEDVINLLNALPRRMVEWMGKALGTKLAKALNSSFGNYTYKLKGRGDGDDRKVLATFSDVDLNPEQVYRRFVDMLNEDSTKKYDWKRAREEFTYVKENSQYYDDNDLKVNASIKAQTALDAVVDMLNEHYLDANKFSSKLVEKREGGDPAVTWLRPPRGKTQSAVEQTSEQSHRSMDPAVADFLFGLVEKGKGSKKPIPLKWQYVTVEVSPGKEGDSVTLLTLALPDLGGKKYTVVVPKDVGNALRDAREGEDYTMEILDYDPSKGFKVSLNDFKNRIILDKKKSIRSTGVTAKQLSSTIRSLIDEYAEKIVGSKAEENVSKAAEQLLGNVIVDGKNIATDQGFKDLIDMHEQRRTIKEQHGVKKKDDEESRDVFKSFERRKEELEEMRKKQEQDIDEDVVWVQHQLSDHKNKLAVKIAEKLSRQVATNPPFTNNMNTWEYGPAFMNKDGVKWLVELAMDEALEPTEGGKVQWRSLIAGILSSNVLADKVRTEKLFGKGTFDKVLPALKVVLVKHNKNISDDEKRKTFDEFRKGTLKVTPEERAEIAKDLSSKSVDTLLDNIVNRVNDGISKLFLEMYYGGDSDAVGIVNVSKARLPERMTKKEKEEWEVGPKKKRVTTSFRTRMDEARAKVQEERTRNSDKARELETLIISGEYKGALKELQSAKVGEDTIASLKSLEQAGVEDPGEEQLLVIENISDAYEAALNKKSDDKLKDVFKSVRTTKAPIEKQSSFYTSIVKLAMSKYPA